jgi:hypothetical protein
MRSDLLSVLERAAILQIGRNAGRAESMTAGRVGEAGLLRPTFDHPQHIVGLHPVLRQPVALTNAGEQPTFFVGSDASGSDLIIEKFAQGVMARYVVAFAAFLVQPQPPALFVLEVVADP